MNVTAAEIWGGCRGEGLVGSFEPPKLQTMRQYNTLIWPQNVENPISEDLNLTNFPGEDATPPPHLQAPFLKSCIRPRVSLGDLVMAFRRGPVPVQLYFSTVLLQLC